jgi:hypothetical protein
VTGVDVDDQRARDRRALALFVAGGVFLFVFFAAGTYLGRWSKATDVPEPTPAPSRSAPQAMVRVEAAATDSRERADEIVFTLRRKYTSATTEHGRSDGLYRVFVGPYPADEAEAVAAEIRDLGYGDVRLEPFGR